jgi:hypothetical protein
MDPTARLRPKAQTRVGDLTWNAKLDGPLGMERSITA